jgi:hypothetical protein
MSRSLPSARSSTSTQRHRRYRAENDSDSRKDEDRESSARILSRIVSRSDRDNKHVRTLLVLTNDRLEFETKRADQAEQRVIDVLQKLRVANDATTIARADASRAQQEVRLYQLQLEQAQREILRAQEIVDQLERARVDAEAEAARSRTIARKCREQWVLSKAREQGRQEGYLEGLEQGRRLAMSQAQGSPVRRLTARTPTPAPPMSPPAAYDGEDDDNEEEEDMEIDHRYERRPASVPMPDVHRVSPPPQ